MSLLPRRRGRGPGPLVVRERLLGGGLPYLAVGQGPPLVVFSAFTAEHANPTDAARRFYLRPLVPLAHHVTVYLVNRKPGLPPGSTIADLAGHYAHALEREFAGPVAIVGVSTGGSIAQQFAIDYPHLVAGWCWSLPRAGSGRLAGGCNATWPGSPWPAGHGAPGRRPVPDWPPPPPVVGCMWRCCGCSDPGCARRTPRTCWRRSTPRTASTSLPSCTASAAPTLLVAGDRDRNYTPELFRETAECIPGARLRLYPGKGHAGIATLTYKPAVREILGFLTEAHAATHH
jgi:pimeloyl-ACP methyl ester carboxylesterase